MIILAIANAKTVLRAELAAARRRFVAALGDGRRSAEEHIAAIALDRLGGARCVAAYLAMGSEVDPAPLVMALARRGVATALPHAAARDGPPSFRRWSPGDTLVAGPFGMLQPADDAARAAPDAIVVPLLAFDGALMRLGRGAGWYDRAFALHPDARRIGLAWSVQAIERTPRDAWDVALHAVVTERDPR